MKDQEKYIEILKMFVGNQDNRQHFHKPFTIENKAISTDAIQLCMMDINKVEGAFEAQEQKYVNGILGVIPQVENMNLEIKIEDLNNIFKDIAVEPKMIPNGKYLPCAECDGDGVVEWEYNSYTNDFDCPVCDGHGDNGKPQLIPSNQNQFVSGSYIEIHKTNFDCNLIQKIIDVAMILEIDMIKLVCESDQHSFVFMVDDVTIITMPIRDIHEGKVYGKI